MFNQGLTFFDRGVQIYRLTKMIHARLHTVGSLQSLVRTYRLFVDGLVGA